MSALDRIADALERIAEQGKASAQLRALHITGDVNAADIANHVARVDAWCDEHDILPTGSVEVAADSAAGLAGAPLVPGRAAAGPCNAYAYLYRRQGTAYCACGHPRRAHTVTAGGVL